MAKSVVLALEAAQGTSGLAHRRAFAPVGVSLPRAIRVKVQGLPRRRTSNSGTTTPPNIEAPVILSPTTGRAAMGPWAGAFGSVEASSGPILYIDTSGHTHTAVEGAKQMSHSAVAAHGTLHANHVVSAGRAGSEGPSSDTSVAKESGASAPSARAMLRRLMAPVASTSKHSAKPWSSGRGRSSKRNHQINQPTQGVL